MALVELYRRTGVPQGEPAMDVGTTLKAAREQRGLSLEQVARSTKIRAATLRAIEANQMDRLPGGIFTRGFLRAYAREVGVDGEEAVRTYMAEFEPPQEVAPPPVAETTWDEAAAAQLRERMNADGIGASVRMLLVGVTAVVALIGYNAFGEAAVNSLTSLIVTQPPPVVRPEPVRTPAPVATSGTPAPAPVVTPPPDPPVVPQSPVHVEIETTGECWVQAWADGASTLAQLLPEGERHVFDANEELVIRIGDAAALAYTVNGKPGRPLGVSGQPVTVRIKPDTVAEFVNP